MGLRVHTQGEGSHFIIGHLAEGKGSSEWRAVAGPFESAEQAEMALAQIKAASR